MYLDRKTAIVTGAASGIGRAVALAYAREGARVVVSDIAEANGEETVRLIQQSIPGAETVFIRADNSRPEDHETLVKAALYVSAPSRRLQQRRHRRRIQPGRRAER